MENTSFQVIFTLNSKYDMQENNIDFAAYEKYENADDIYPQASGQNRLQ